MRSRTSIKTRVTAWYVFFLILIVCLLFTTLGYTSSRIVQEDIKGDLKSVVEYSRKDVKITDGKLTIDRNMIHNKNGISVLVYKENNFIVTGSLPDNIQNDIPFIDKSIREITDNGNRFYIYDYLISSENYPDVWIRGITSANLADYDPLLNYMSRGFLFIFPLLVLLAALGGYLITRRAFKPVAQITDTVKSIQAGGDLSKRIGLDDINHSKDEIYNLAATFDDMLGRLESSFESEKQFSNDASHELRTPLAVIMAECEYAMKDGCSEDDIRESLDVIYGQTSKMSALISRLLMIARADRGTLALNYEQIDVSELTSIVALEQELAAEEKNITITQSIEPGIIASVDEAMFIRIWANLISNSIKYSSEHGHIEILLTSDSQYIRGSVKDNGIGISQENLPKIWNRFYQVDPSRNDSGSAGLGLSIVKWIVEQHGGSIDASSTLGKGTEITFKLPLNNIKKEVTDYE